MYLLWVLLFIIIYYNVLFYCGRPIIKLACFYSLCTLHATTLYPVANLHGGLGLAAWSEEPIRARHGVRAAGWRLGEEQCLSVTVPHTWRLLTSAHTPVKLRFQTVGGTMRALLSK